MTTTRKLIIAFWIFIVAMGLWEIHSYNSGLNEQAAQRPSQKSFFFYPPSTTPATPSTKHAEGADVQQTAFVIENNTPPGSYTCHVTLKNMGNAKATGIQIMVRPYRGVSNYDEDAGGGQKPIVLTDDDPLSKLGVFLSFPDLAPGESATCDTSFINRVDFQPGKNPQPNILFNSEKPPGNQPTRTPMPPLPGGGG